jgi:hypothetical protein
MAPSARAAKAVSVAGENRGEGTTQCHVTRVAL